MANQRLTKKKLKNHLAYSWWKYALAAAVSTMLVSIVFAVTEYRPPDDKKVEFYVLNSYADTETMQADFWPLLQARKPEQEKLTVININLTDSSNIYAPMQFSTYVAAQQGDLFLICLLYTSVARKPADHDGIRRIEEQLQNAGEHNWKRKKQHLGQKGAFRHIHGAMRVGLEHNILLYTDTKRKNKDSLL